MEGTSRTSLAQLQDVLSQDPAATGTGGDAGSLAQDLLSLSALLGRESQLRAVLTSTGASAQSKGELVQSLFGNRIGAAALPVLTAAAQSRWSRSRDLVDALEVLGAQAAFSSAEAAGTLPRVEEELFRVSRAIIGSSQLRTALSDREVPVESRTALIRDLIGTQADATTVSLVEHAVASSRGRRVENVLEQFVELASARRSEVIAEVAAAIELSAEQEQRLTAVLGRIYASAVRLQITVDPTLQGGIVVRIGDEVIDGSVIHRLEQARAAVVR